MAKRSRATEDFISHLPGDITDNILLRLPLQEAVRTSLLSKNWRHKWRTCPGLRFERSTFSSASKSRSDFLTIIHQVLLQHQGPISKFFLSLPQLGSCPEIDHLISYLSTKGIEKFSLYVGETHTIPSYLFSCLKLKLLCLRNCVLKPPADFAGFAKLTNLELRSVDLPDSFAETFVAKCPSLERLKLHKCTNLDRIDFDAPNLQLLDYHGRISSISFKNTPSLKNVSLESVTESVYVESPICDLKLNTWIDTFCLLPSLEYLRLGGILCLMLAAGIGRDILASKLKCLKTLVLSLPIVSPRTTRCTLNLIKSSPNLQKLVIDWTPLPKQGNRHEIQFSKLKESSDIFLEKLQSIEMSSFSGLGPHMAFIEFLLAKSPMLETMLIYHLKGWSLDQENTALRKINQVPRASPRAKVNFFEAS